MSEIIFQPIPYELGTLVKLIEMGDIGLPDLQRPFIWKNAKVRDLFDSIYQGYPVGYFLFWQTISSEDSKTIGAEDKPKTPKLLIVDGQQRLTGLYAVIKGMPVIRENYQAEKIEIAFNPLTEKFKVSDAAIKNDKTYIPNISRLWASDNDVFEFVGNYLDNLKVSRNIEKEDEKRIKRSIGKLNGILNFPFTVLELFSNINEEQVSEVFVRINSEGKPLKQADFILTLMSVFWDEGRFKLEEFCRQARRPSNNKPSPFNYFIEPDPNQLLRVSVGLGFKRAKLRYVYSILRGKDLEKEFVSEKLREEQFAQLKEAQEKVLNLLYWHDFLKVLVQAGYRSGWMISSESNLLFCYTLYLIGRVDYGVKDALLRKTLAKWFFMSSLTGRYTGSQESRMEFDLANFRNIKSADEFIGVLDKVCEDTLTGDFWEISLPSELATSAPRSPALFAYFAALNLLEAKVLFSDLKVSELLDPATKSEKSAVERHHLFPKAYLKSIGMTDKRDINQNGNYALVEWGDNLTISKQGPAKYFPIMMERIPNKERERMCFWHALPDGWENMEYKEFLIQRRELMSKVIKEGYLKLSKDRRSIEEKVGPSIHDLIAKGETTETEFKSTLRINLHTGQKDPKIEFYCLRTIAGFINRDGGTLIIGVADDGDPVGIESDKFLNEDKMLLHLDNLIKERFGPELSYYIHPRFEEYQDVRVLAVECWKGKKPVFLKDGKEERFFLRMGASTTELTGRQMQDYIKGRFDK